jgi:hypothetical protein
MKLNWIEVHLAYRYGASDASTDASETLAGATGVCRDFAHVGIALVRGLKIPARTVVAYLRGLAPMDLHACSKPGSTAAGTRSLRHRPDRRAAGVTAAGRPCRTPPLQ